MLTRRTATVTMSAPEASITRLVSAKSLNFPVPTIRRDFSSIEPMRKRSSAIPASDEVDDFNPIPLLDRRGREGAPLDNRQIHFDRHAIRDDAEIGEQSINRRPAWQRGNRPVDRDRHAVMSAHARHVAPLVDYSERRKLKSNRGGRQPPDHTQ